jgi:microcystin-dependent protein
MEPFLGEIRLFANTFAPKGWALCNGQLLQISTNQALYSLLGTTYGGDGKTTFALPDLRGRAPVHPSSSIPRGKSGGEAAHSLTLSEMPAHSHAISGSSEAANEVSPDGKVWGTYANLYSMAAPTVVMNEASIEKTGAGAAHPNMQPYLAVNFCIATTGLYPTHN